MRASCSPHDTPRPVRNASIALSSSSHIDAGTLSFTLATGLAPIAYVQRLRVEDAKRRLERTDAPIDDISWRVGYEDAAFFRRLFKRTTGMTPGDYRKRFRIPDFARR
jgi:transcriptional regulator GlxA family with amidase domain